MEDKINRIFDKLENADVSPSANYSMPEYYMHCAMHGREREKRTLFNMISMFTGIDIDLINKVFNERYNIQNESRNMRQTIRLRESKLRRMISETVRRILRESDKRYAWDLTDDGVEEISMDGNWPSDHWDNEHNWNRSTTKGANAIRMGLDQQSGNDWKQGSIYNNPYAQDNRKNARDYVNKGKYYPYGFATQLWDDNAEDDLEDFNNAEQRKMTAADKRWQKASDSRPLHRKGSLNRAMDESINRIVSESIRRNLR